MPARQTRPLSPAEAVRQGRKLIAERRKAEARARLLPWSPPAVVETTVVRVSLPAPARWPRVWVRPQVALRYEVLGFVPSKPPAVAQPEPLPARGRGGAEVEAGKPVSEKVQRVEVVSSRPESPDNSPATLYHSKAALRVRRQGVEPSSTPPAVLRNRPRDMHVAMSVFPTSSEVTKTDTHPDGAWPLADLRSGQCRFACTADDAPRDQHRFCGRPTRIGRSNLHGSWCDEHLPRVWGTGTVSERNAHLVTKDVRRFG